MTSNEGRSDLGGKTLYFRRTDRDDSLIFASPEVAAEVSAIHRAIEESDTWGDFRRRLPPGEYETLFSDQFSSDAHELSDNPQLAHPADDLPFSSDAVPGYCDGDYPMWIASVQDRYVPQDLLDRFGAEEESTHNGSCWRIGSEHRDAILADLTQRGFTVIERADLKFF